MKEKIIKILIKTNKYIDELEKMKSERVKGNKKDIVTKGDLEIGRLIVEIFLNDGSKKVIIESEEYGKQQNFREGHEEYYVVIDDIDGSNNLRVGKGLLPYCSMIVVFEKNKNSSEYKFSDYSYAACIDHTRKRIFYTEKGLGCVEEYDTNGQKICDSKENNQDNSQLVLTLSGDIVSSTRGGKQGYVVQDEVHFEKTPFILSGLLQKYAMVDSGCSVFEYAMIGMGIRNGYVSNGKKMHELPLLYAFCKENGDDMCDFRGKSYDEVVYDFNKGDVEVIAGNSEVIKDVSLLIQNQINMNRVIQKRIITSEYVARSNNTK